MKLSIRAVIREALIVHESRNLQISMIKNILGVSRIKAKELLFSFLYNAEDSHLMKIAQKEDIIYKASSL